MATAVLCSHDCSSITRRCDRSGGSHAINPGKPSFASSGAGGALHLQASCSKPMAGLDMIHVPYKASTLAHPNLLSARTSILFDTMAAISTQFKSDKVRALGLTTSKRSSVLPQVPPLTEAGMAGYETSTWCGIPAPAGTPKAVVTKLNLEINKALNSPEVLNDCVADTTMGLLIDVARQFSASDRYLRAGQWLKAPFPLTTRVSGKRLGFFDQHFARISD